MKKKSLKKLNIIADYLEIIIAILVVILIVVAIGMLLRNFGLLFDLSFTDEMFNSTLGSIMYIVIGIEFLKMLIKHDIESIVEVLLFAISRKLLISNSSSMDFLIGIIAISILLIVRKFLFVPELDD